MIDNVYAPPQAAGMAVPVVTEVSSFYVVSPKKLALLSLATFGLYNFYWRYKQWRNYKDSRPLDEEAQDMWPVARSIFAVFFIHSLFNRVRAHAPGNASVADWSAGRDATVLVVLLLVSGVLSRISMASGSNLLDTIVIGLLFPIAFMMCLAQVRINAACGDPDGASNARFSAANYVWLVLGAVFWVLVVIGLAAG